MRWNIRCKLIPDKIHFIATTIALPVLNMIGTYSIKEISLRLNEFLLTHNNYIFWNSLHLDLLAMHCMVLIRREDMHVGLIAQKINDELLLYQISY